MQQIIFFFFISQSFMNSDALACLNWHRKNKEKHYFFCHYKSQMQVAPNLLWYQILSPFIVKEGKHLFTCMLIKYNLYVRLELDTWCIPLLNSSTYPYILAMMQPAPERTRMLRRRAHAVLHRTTLSRATTIMNLPRCMPCQWWHKPSSMHHQALSVHKRNSWVTHWFFFMLS